jgi:hypothetical protein
MRDLTRSIAAGFYPMGIGIGNGKDTGRTLGRNRKNVGFLHSAGPLLVFAYHRSVFRRGLALRAVQSDSIPENDIAG